MTIVKENFLLREDIWFDQEPEKKNDLDVLYYYYQTTPPSIPSWECDEEYTLLIDLTQDRDEIWKRINRNSRYEIKRASRKDLLIYEFWERIDSERLDEFFDFHAQFTASQGLRNLRKSVKLRLKNYAQSGVLNLSRVKLKDEKDLTWHVYYYSKHRVFLLHSASIKNSADNAYKRLVGRANRYHHWRDILTYKERGISVYDFGGWYANTDDQKLIYINQFKEEFGGELVKNFNWRHGLTLKGKLFLLLRKMLLSSP